MHERDASAEGADVAAPGPAPPAGIDGAWVSLFSGGKDSSWALYRALAADRDVDRLVTVHPSRDSYMYHVPATELAALAAESVGLELLEVESGDLGADDATDAGEQGDRELAVLADALAELDAALPDGIGGVVAGAVESAFQTDRIEAMCAELDAALYAPLYGQDPRALADAMLAAGFEITVVQVAAGGLDESWLGRTLDRAAFEELAALGDSHGVHLLGEGGEYETLVTDGPHMERAIELDAEPEWEGTRGRLRIADAWLAE